MTSTPLVDIATVEPGIIVDIRYATKDNFLKRAVYPVNRCLLVPSAAQRLARAHRALKAKGYGIKVWDCYRPQSVQRLLWELKPDERYVAPPHRGSRHNRGAAVDITLVDASGKEQKMPTAYDDFSVKANRSYKKIPAEAKKNYKLLDDAMTAEGFLGLPDEWWHYDDPDWEKFPLLDIPLE